MNPWKDEDHFVSWLRAVSGQSHRAATRGVGKRSAAHPHRASIALKMAASTLRVRNTYLGGAVSPIRTRLGAPVAIKAMAAKLARLVYRMLRYGMKYVDRERSSTRPNTASDRSPQLKWKAAKLGFHVVEAAA